MNLFRRNVSCFRVSGAFAFQNAMGNAISLPRHLTRAEFVIAIATIENLLTRISGFINYILLTTRHSDQFLVIYVIADYLLEIIKLKYFVPASNYFYPQF